MPEENFVAVGRMDDIQEGTALYVEINDVPVAVFNCDGHFYAIDDTCSHEEASLSEGELVGPCTVECPLHGAQFDLRTGKALCLPATLPVHTYEVRVEDGLVKVQPPEPERW
jgi:3-phenylpropionate/trans-cinnamate dioxygenase ferredoxin component